MMQRVVGSILFVTLMPATWACDLCAIYSAAKGNGKRAGWFASVAQQYTYYATLQKDGDHLADPADQRLDSSITQLTAGYQFTDRWSAQVNVPLIYRGYTRGDDVVVERGAESGVGDVSVTAHYRLWSLVESERVVFVDALGGVKLPTGNSRRLAEEAAGTTTGRITPQHAGHGDDLTGVHGHDLALGSGSVDGVVGLSTFASWRRWFLTASAQYMIRSEGDYDYQYANDFLWHCAPGYYVVADHERTLGVQLTMSGEAKGKDTSAGEKADDTGMVSLFLGPGLLSTWRDRLHAEVAVGLPVMRENTAIQLVPDVRIRSAVTWRF